MKPRVLVGLLLLGLGAGLLGPSPVRASPPAQVSGVVEIVGDPLRIQVFANGSLQVFHRDYVLGAAYGQGASGAFIALGTTVYGPVVPVGPDVIEYANIGLEGPFGRGTAGDPYRLVSTHRLTGSGADLGIVQTISYVDGENRFRLEWLITNYGSQQACFKLYHAADLYFADSDRGYGYHDGQTGAVGGFNEGQDWFMVFIPLVPADHFREASFGTIWADVGAGRDLDDTIDSNYLDNGAALQWNACVSPGQAVTLGDLWSFGSSESEVISTGAGRFRPTGPLASELTTYIPTPLDVSLDPAVVGTNLLFAALAMIAFVSASGLLTKLLGEHQRELVRKSRLVRWISVVQAFFIAAFGARLSRTSLVGFVKLIGIIVFYGFVFSLLDRTWSPFSLAGLWLFVSMTIAYGVVGIAADIVQWIAARRWGLPAELTLRPTSVLLAIFSTIASRVFGLLPGLMFGTPEAFEVDPKAVDPKRERSLLMVAAATLLVIGIGAWMPTIVTALLLRVDMPEFVLAVLGGAQSFLLVVFAVTVENGFFQMLPLPGNVGEALRRWNRWLWLAGLSAVLFLFFHLLLNPSGSLAEALRNGNVRFFILTVILFCLGVGAVWLYIKLAGARASAPARRSAPVVAAKVGEPGVVVLDAEPIGPGEGAGQAEGQPEAARAKWVISERSRGPASRRLRIGPLAFGLIGLAAALFVGLIGVVCLVVALVATFG